MSLWVFFRVDIAKERAYKDLESRAYSAARRVANNVSPTIWNLYKKSTDRKYTDEVAAAILDSELHDDYIVAINVYGNFGHLYMGRIKVLADTIVTFDKAKHQDSSITRLSEEVSLPIKQGSMSIGSVKVFYSRSNLEESLQSALILELISLIIITSLIIFTLYFALRTSNSRRIAEAATATKSEFLANMSHEIRTPLNGILGLLEVISHGNLDDDQRYNLSVISSSSRTLLNIINDILDFSKIEAGKINIAPNETDLKELINSITESFKKTAIDKNLDFTINISSRIPRTILIDDTRVKQILFNLIGNALKFTEQGGVTVSIQNLNHTTSIQKHKEITLLFKIEDTGIGVSEKDQEKLFQSFSQAESSTTRRFGGTGLGLAISLRLAQIMGGDLQLKSQAGQGSCFNYLQPVIIYSEEQLEVQSITATNIKKTDQDYAETVNCAPTERSVIAPTKPSKETNGEGIILVVEDNATNRLVMKKQLELLGHSADFAEDGVIGYKMWERGNYQLILSDCQMPEMDGYQMAQAIRKKEDEINLIEHTPIIAFTANAMQHEIELCYESGMNDFIGKPCSKDELAQKLDRWLPKQAAHAS